MCAVDYTAPVKIERDGKTSYTTVKFTIKYRFTAIQ